MDSFPEESIGKSRQPMRPEHIRRVTRKHQCGEDKFTVVLEGLGNKDSTAELKIDKGQAQEFTSICFLA